jgi:hypothetical protein
MKNLILLPMFALITGCATVTTPVKHSLPEPSKVLTETCPPLKQLPEKEERLSELLKVVVENYTVYHECGTKHELLVKWYNEQKALHDALFNKR